MAGKNQRNQSALNNFLQGLIGEYNYYFNPASMIKKKDGTISNYSPVQSPTINNAPPVGQSGNVEPLPFFKYQPPVGQNTINFNTRNPDPRITIDEAPPVYQQTQPSKNYEDDEFENILMALRNYKGY